MDKKTAILAAAALGLAASPAAAQSFTTALSGPDADGSGTAKVTVKGDQVCYEVQVKGTAPATAAHIHKGAAGASGPVAVPFKAPDADGKSAGCATVTKELAGDITAHPAEYYVNVHTAEFPAGAVRGQLGK